MKRKVLNMRTMELQELPEGKGVGRSGLCANIFDDDLFFFDEYVEANEDLLNCCVDIIKKHKCAANYLAFRTKDFERDYNLAIVEHSDLREAEKKEIRKQWNKHKTWTQQKRAESRRRTRGIYS